MPSRYSDHPLREHDVFTLETPGGGDFGDPFARDPGRVVSDVNEGYVSAERALADYGVAVTNSGGEWVLDDVGTRARRTCGV